jgi:hypothetical protein
MLFPSVSALLSEELIFTIFEMVLLVVVRFVLFDVVEFDLFCKSPNPDSITIIESRKSIANEEQTRIYFKLSFSDIILR